MVTNKQVIKELKKKVQDLSFKDLTERDIIRNLKTLYYENVRVKEISYETYLEVTSYLVLLKAIRTPHHIK